MTAFHYDSTGKISLDHIYNQPDPRAYYSTLGALDYCIPEAAKPVFRRLIEARRQLRGDETAKLLDIGCSYGVNAALLKHGLSMDELYRLYGPDAPEGAAALRRRDQNLYSEPKDAELSVVGLDIADRAVAYAVGSGLLDAGLTVDLETDNLTPGNLAAVSDIDMIISTGCVGYVTESTLEKLVDANEQRAPWMANFVLRMFDYEPVEAMMAKRGYVTETLEGFVFPQRRFASVEEGAHVLANLDHRGVAPDGLEAEGWYFAQLHLSRPTEEARLLPLVEMLDGSVAGPAAAAAATH